MSIFISTQENPSKEELHNFFEDVFAETTDSANFSDDKSQKLDEWFSVDEMFLYLPNGRLIEARLEDGLLVGCIFIGKQNPISWLDGKKMEIFILGVDKEYRGNNIAKQLIQKAEDFAASQGAQKIIVNTHIDMKNVHTIYKKLGYAEIGILKEYYDNGDAVFFQKLL